MDRRHWLIERRVRVYPRIILAMVLLTIPLYALTFQDGLDGRGRPVGSDFIAFWSAAHLAVTGHGLQAWDLGHLMEMQFETWPGLGGPTAWVYPPTTLLMVTPLGFLPYSAAFWVYTALGVGAFLWALAPLLRDRRHAWAIALAFPGLWVGVAHGQTQFIVAALVGGALLLLRRHPILAGVLIGLLAIKPHLAVLFPLVLIAGGYWRTFFTAAVSATTFMLTSAAAFGWETLRAWFSGMELVSSAVDVEALPTYKFVTPYSAFRLTGLPQEPALVLHALGAMVVACVVWRVWRRCECLALRGSSFVVGTFLVTPYAADYDLAMLAFPITWLATIGLDRGWLRGDRNLLVVAWLLPALTAPIALGTHLCVVPLVLAMMLLQVWRRAGPAAHAPPVTAQVVTA